MAVTGGYKPLLALNNLPFPDFQIKFLKRCLFQEKLMLVGGFKVKIGLKKI
jgi:hypothetical protein